MTAATLSPSSAKVKFRLAGGAQPLILLPVHVNDRGPFDFILDTGAGTSLLSSELAKQLEAKVIGSKEGQSAGGKVSVSLAKVDSISVGEILSVASRPRNVNRANRPTRATKSE